MSEFCCSLAIITCWAPKFLTSLIDIKQEQFLHDEWNNMDVNPAQMWENPSSTACDALRATWKIHDWTEAHTEPKMSCGSVMSYWVLVELPSQIRCVLFVHSNYEVIKPQCKRLNVFNVHLNAFLMNKSVSQKAVQIKDFYTRRGI